MQSVSSDIKFLRSTLMFYSNLCLNLPRGLLFPDHSITDFYIYVSSLL